MVKFHGFPTRINGGKGYTAVKSLIARDVFIPVNLIRNCNRSAIFSVQLSSLRFYRFRSLLIIYVRIFLCPEGSVCGRSFQDLLSIWIRSVARTSPPPSRRFKSCIPIIQLLRPSQTKNHLARTKTRRGCNRSRQNSDERRIW